MDSRKELKMKSQCTSRKDMKRKQVANKNYSRSLPILRIMSQRYSLTIETKDFYMFNLTMIDLNNILKPGKRDIKRNVFITSFSKLVPGRDALYETVIRVEKQHFHGIYLVMLINRLVYSEERIPSDIGNIILSHIAPELVMLTGCKFVVAPKNYYYYDHLTYYLSSL